MAAAPSNQEMYDLAMSNAEASAARGNRQAHTKWLESAKAFENMEMWTAAMAAAEAEGNEPSYTEAYSIQETWKQVAQDAVSEAQLLDTEGVPVAGPVTIPVGANIGIALRNPQVWQVFCNLARGDFHHDFNDDRAKVGQNDFDTFFAIVKTIGSAKGKPWWTARFTEIKGSTPAGLYEDGVNQVLPPSREEFPKGFPNEEQLMELVGINYRTLKNGLKLGDYASGTGAFEIPNTGITRNYDIRAALYKNEDGTVKNLSHIFRQVTGAAEDSTPEIVLVVDAVTGLSTTEFLNGKLNPPTNGCKFYIVENIENTSDSATKISALRAELADGAVPAELNYLVDNPTSISYPIWTNTGEDQRTNIFSKLDIVLRRINDRRVDGDIVGELNGGTSISTTIENLSSASNVTNASLAMIANAIEKGVESEAMVYALIKRMGDWCQALSLLDLQRSYTILDSSRVSTATSTTLSELIAGGAEVAILTTDRIVLAFGILLGLNVFLTTGTDVRKLVYFKNTEGVALDPGAQDAKANAILAQVSAELDPANPDRPIDNARAFFSDALMPKVGEIQTNLTTTTDIFAYIQLLRVYTSNVGKVTSAAITAFDSMRATLEADVAAVVDPTEKLRLATRALSAINAVKIERETNTRVYTNLTSLSYPGVEADTAAVTKLQTKIASNLRLTAAEDVVRDIVLDMRDAVRSFPNPQGLFELLDRPDAQFPNPNASTDGKPNMRDVIPKVFDALDTLKVLTMPAAPAGGQRGGAAIDTYKFIRNREIKLLPKDAVDTISIPGMYSDKDVFVDTELNTYSILDEYIVTDDDLPLFQGAFDNPPNTFDTFYVCLKFLILKCDYCANELRRIYSVLPRSDDLDTYTLEYGTPDYDALEDVHAILLQIAIAYNGGAPLIPQHLILFNEDYPTELIRDENLFQVISDIVNRLRQQISSTFQTTFEEQIKRVAPEEFDSIVKDSIDNAVPSLPVNPDKYSDPLAKRILDMFGSKIITEEILAGIGGGITQALTNETSGSLTNDFTPHRIADVVMAALTPGLTALVPRITSNQLALLRTYVRGIRMEELKAFAGGLRKRRPLYRNARSVDVAIQPERNEGLRERRRTRRAPRIRQSARKSRSGRQRDNVDSV